MTKRQVCFTFIVKYTLHKEVGVKTEISKLRKSNSLSQQQLADAVGVSRQTIVSLEGERYVASLQLANKISKYFGKTIEEVFHLEEN